MTTRTRLERLERLERGKVNDEPQTIAAVYRDADGHTVHVAQPERCKIGGPVDYRAGIWEAS